MKRNFLQMSEYLPEVKQDGVEIAHFVPDNFMLLRARMSGDYLKEGYTYTKLLVNGSLWMSDTPMEINTNRDFVRNANGHVLIFGLGMGLIVLPLLQDENIKSITVVEINNRVIEVVLPLLKKHDKTNKLIVHEGDANTHLFRMSKETKYDTIYFDIWKDICGDNYENMKTLERSYRKFLNKDNPYKYMDCWIKGECRRLAKNDRQYCYFKN